MSQIKKRHPLLASVRDFAALNSISTQINKLLYSYSNNRIGVILGLLFVLNVPVIAQKISGADRLKLP
jgi:hypothetical protein